MTQWCSDCKTMLPLTAFSPHARGKSSQICRACRKVRTEKWLKPRRDLVDNHKLAHGCADCGLMSPHPFVYDLDHLPGFEKVMKVSDLITKARSLEEIAAEMAKCEVICANCHRIRTALRGKVRGPGRARPGAA